MKKTKSLYHGRRFPEQGVQLGALGQKRRDTSFLLVNRYST
ncbi:hypothetical protein [Paraburkholderia sp.]|nr:hypothetical protein [Paraburkholderia sp.]